MQQTGCVQKHEHTPSETLCKPRRVQSNESTKPARVTHFRLLSFVWSLETTLVDEISHSLQL